MNDNKTEINVLFLPIKKAPYTKVPIYYIYKKIKTG